MSNYSDGHFNTKYGTIHVHNPGSKHTPENLQTYIQSGSRYVRLQGPALRAFKAAELRITPRWMKLRGKVRHILLTGSGYRSYDTQYTLYRSDSTSGRYANPDGSMHVEGLAVDVSTNQSARRQRQIRKALEAEGWHYAVPGEPWHASYRLPG